VHALALATCSLAAQVQPGSSEKLTKRALDLPARAAEQTSTRGIIQSEEAVEIIFLKREGLVCLNIVRRF